jgi:phage shock protein PspC (stress-responsive transcriptional regulator)
LPSTQGLPIASIIIPAPSYPAGGHSGAGAAPGTAYAPPQGPTYPTGAPGAAGYPTTGYPPPGPQRRLTRSRSDRWLGGVCGGLARYWNTDPTLLRILTIVLTLATGGALLVGYVIAWIAIPDEPAPPYSPYGQAPGGPQVGYAAGGNPPYADQATYTYVPPPPRERSYLGWLVVSIAVLVAGVLGLLGALLPSTAATPGIIGGIALAILGIGLVVGTWYGRARWLTLLAIPVALFSFVAVAAGAFVQSNPNWDRWIVEGTDGQLEIGNRTWVVTPEDRADSPLDFRVTAGDAVLDLTALTNSGDAEPGDTRQRIEIDPSVGAGNLRVIVPEDMQLDLTASVDLGELSVPGEPVGSGTDLDVTTTIDPAAEGQPAYIVTLDAAVGVGNLEVVS